MEARKAEIAGSIWVFGYGSLVWRPAFPFLERERAYIHGWVRRFWQGSTDHRGTPAHPGRVVTLVPADGREERCWGMAYKIESKAAASVLATLDHREKGGYDRKQVTLHLPDSARQVEAEIYIATPENPNYLGPAPISEIAEQVLRSVGPSGPNQEYVLELDQALRDIRGVDPHVEALADSVREKQAQRK